MILFYILFDFNFKIKDIGGQGAKPPVNKINKEEPLRALFYRAQRPYRSYCYRGLRAPITTLVKGPQALN